MPSRKSLLRTPSKNPCQNPSSLWHTARHLVRTLLRTFSKQFREPFQEPFLEGVLSHNLLGVHSTTEGKAGSNPQHAHLWSRLCQDVEDWRVDVGPTELSFTTFVFRSCPCYPETRVAQFGARKGIPTNLSSQSFWRSPCKLFGVNSDWDPSFCECREGFSDDSLLLNDLCGPESMI